VKRIASRLTSEVVRKLTSSHLAVAGELQSLKLTRSVVKPAWYITFLVFQSHAAGRLAGAHTIDLIDGVAERLGAISPEGSGGQMLETRGTVVGVSHRKRCGT